MSGDRARRVVIAPDSFKGSISASDAAAALADGWRSARPGDELVLAPMADGGEGTLTAFMAAVPGARRVPVTVEGPTGRPVEASWVSLPDGTAVVELASTCGIELLGPGELSPLTASTRGLGQAIDAALAAGAGRLLVAIGSSASSDGGAGALTALGATVTDHDGAPIGPGAIGLMSVDWVDLTTTRAVPPGGVVVLSDVTAPLLGRDGAAAVFAPQKGASAADVGQIETALRLWAERVPGADPAAPGAGAAGGTGFGLMAWGARLRPGAAEVAATIDLRERLRGADLAITGEGAFDAQTARGKAPTLVRELAAELGVPLALVAGRFDADPRAIGFADAVELAGLAGGSEAALADPARWLQAAGARLAQRLAD